MHRQYQNQVVSGCHTLKWDQTSCRRYTIHKRCTAWHSSYICSTRPLPWAALWSAAISNTRRRTKVRRAEAVSSKGPCACVCVCVCVCDEAGLAEKHSHVSSFMRHLGSRLAQCVQPAFATCIHPSAQAHNKGAVKIPKVP